MRPALSACLVALAASFCGTAHAYVRSVSISKTGEPFIVRWPNPHVSMTILTGGQTIVPADALVAAATRAGATWSDPALGSEVHFTLVRSNDAHVDAAFDKMNTISFKTDEWDDQFHQPEALAITTYFNQGSKIVDADTEINGVTPSYTWAILPDDPALAAMSTDIDLVATLTHELGHVIGLDHPCFLGDGAPIGEKTNTGEPVPSCSDPNLPESVREATMYPSATAGAIGERTLSPDEVLALHDIYPEHAGGCAIGGGGASTSAGLLVVAACMLLARRRRSRAG